MARQGQKSMHRGPKTGGGGGGGKKFSKPPLTHFLCIPLVNASSKPQLEGSLRRFTEETRSLQAPVKGVESSRNESGEQEHGKSSSSSGDKAPEVAPNPNASTSAESRSNPASGGLIPERAIRPLETLHLTLGVMSLQSESRIEEAIHFLQSIDTASLLQEAAELRDQDPSIALSTGSKAPASTSQEPLIVSLDSLTSMHPPHKTSILYASPSDPTFRLLPFCSSLVGLFRSADLLVPDDRPLKLHATIVNNIYAKPGGRGGGHGPKAKAPIRLDARNVLDKYQDWVWAKDVTLGKVALCKMGAKKVFADDGTLVAEEYKEVASVPLPV